MTIEMKIGQRTFCCQVKGKTAMVTIHPVDTEKWMDRFLKALPALVAEIDQPEGPGDRAKENDRCDPNETTSSGNS